MSAGQILHLEVSASTGNPDPLIVLVKPDGSAAAANDNKDSYAGGDALIDEYAAPEDERYTLFITSTFNGGSGMVQILSTTEN